MIGPCPHCHAEPVVMHLATCPDANRAQRMGKLANPPAPKANSIYDSSALFHAEGEGRR